MRKYLMATLVVVSSTAIPAAAHADILLTPFAGVTFASKSGDDEVGAEIELDNRWAIGGALAVLGTNGLGFEVDLGFIPDFFEPKDLDIDLLGTNNVTTLMGNLMFVGNAGSVRPYLTGGAGLIRSQLGDFGELFDATESSFGINAGAGLLLGSGRVSLRGDLRYFRNVSESDDPLIDEALKDMRFWRGTVGVSFGF
jgi:opacity protein-like surface antigen